MADSPVTSKDVNTSPEACIKFWMENGLSREAAQKKCSKRKETMSVGELSKQNDTTVGGVDVQREGSFSGGLWTVKSP